MMCLFKLSKFTFSSIPWKKKLNGTNFTNEFENFFKHEKKERVLDEHGDFIQFKRT